MKYALLLLAACGGTTAPATVGNVAVATDTSLHAVLILHPWDAGRAYVLGCMRGGVSVASDDCSRLLVDTELELLVGPPAIKVRAADAARSAVCPTGEPYEPFVWLDGAPLVPAGGSFLVSPGLAVSHQPGRVPAASIASKQVAMPTKGPGEVPPEPTSVFGVDLDGDGNYEIVVENLGKYTLYDQLGNELGSVGCVFG